MRRLFLVALALTILLALLAVMLVFLAAAGESAAQCGIPLGAAEPVGRAAHPRALTLDHDRRQLGQLLDLMTDRIADRDPLCLAERVPTLAPLRPVHDYLVRRPRWQQLPPVPLMTRLGALLATRRPLGRGGGFGLS